MIDELQVLKIVTKKLASEDIQYMLTGSIAANFYSIPRMTRDIDIVIDVLESDADKLIKLFSKDYYIDEKSARKSIRNKKMFNIIHNEALIKVDFIIKKNIDYRILEFNRKKVIDFEGEKIYITCAEDLVISKLLWAKESESEIQIRDVKNLLASNLDLDFKYIDKWIGNLDLLKIYKKVSNG